jgi:HemX protein
MAAEERNRLRSRRLQTILGAVNILLPIAYLLVAVDYGFLFFSAHPVAVRTATPALRGTVVLHLAGLVAIAIQDRQFPAATVSQALSVVALAVALVYVFVEWRGRERSTGFWLVAMVFFFQLLASILARPNAPNVPNFRNAVFATHVSLALLGYAAFVVAAVYAFLYLQLYRDLKAGRYTTFFGKLPPLEVLERMMLGALRAGLVALTGAVLAGAFWGERNIAPGFSLHDPKILITLATWLIYAAALLLRRLRRWQGRQTALASIAGLCVILFSLVAVNFFFTGFHGFH